MSIVRVFVALCLCCAGALALAQTPAPQAPQSITVVLDDNYPPYIFHDSKGQIQGILKDTWALWQARTGVTVVLKPMAWAQALQEIHVGQADVIDTIFKTPARQQLYDFSKPYAQIEVSIFFHHSIGGIVDTSSVRGFTVGVKEGDACIDSLHAAGVDTLKAYNSYSAVVSAAQSGDVRVFCMDEPPAAYLLNQRGLSQDFRHSQGMASGAFHRAVKKGDARMLALVEDGFSRITAAEYQQIQDKWYGTHIHGWRDSLVARYLPYAAEVLCLLALVLVLWNLTLRRRVREKTRVLSQSLERLQKLTDRVPGMVYQYMLRTDGSACFPFASDAIRDIYRVDPQQAQADAACVIANLHPDDMAGILESIAQSARQLMPWQHEYRVKFDDGTVRWLFGNALPEKLADGSVLWHGFITDITERMAVEDRLRQLSRTVEQAPMAIVITDLQGSIQYANPSFTSVTGYTPEEVLYKNPRILQSGLTRPEIYADLWRTLRAGGVWQGELHNRKKSGEIFVEHAVIAPVFDADGRATHYVALKEDITQSKHDELALKTSLKEKVALLHEVHHRVKNNLQVITSLLRLEAGRSTSPDTKAVLKEMQGRIYAMALLHESLYRAGTFAEVDLSAYIRQLAMQAFRAQGAQSGAVRLVLELNAVNVGMDQATPCGLLVNELLSNCLKHGFPDDRAGQVLVQLQPTDRAGWWRLWVQDDGIGLPADFEARRAQSLGLQLVSDLARQLGGTLDIGAGTGAAFAVEFPVQVFPLPD
jgi:PAS domain S-box-containing protein